MQKVKLKKVQSMAFRKSDIIDCEYGEQVTESCLLESSGEVIGFFIKDTREVSDKASKLLAIANMELMSKRVPKSGRMGGGGKGGALDKGGTGIPFKVGTSAIIGATPPKAYLGRPYRSMSSLHLVESAKNYIKSMTMLANETELIVKRFSESIWREHKDAMERVSKKWRLGSFYTSSVSNISCTVPVHSDKKNIEGTVNAIYCRRKNCGGGNLMLPEYNVTLVQGDYSLLVYPAWRDLHGVTPIHKLCNDGFRNTLVFYSLKDFLD